MTLNQALAVIKSKKGQSPTRTHYLACGFEPLHLATFLRAYLLEMLAGDDVALLHGIYGDLYGNIQAASQSAAIEASVVIEWSDLDPRLGLRASRGWSAETKTDILQSLDSSTAKLEVALAQLGAKMPVAIAGPSLPLPAIGNTIELQSSVLELELEQRLAAFLARLSRLSGLRIARPPGAAAPPEDRLDSRMELMAGFPYKLPYASLLARTLVALLWQPQPKKGLITDLDNTLWAGIVGEVGVHAVSWHQDSHTQVHALYQQMLGHLASMGVLLGVSSKNEQSVAESALARKDLLLDAKCMYPVIANWGAKSVSVARILQTWNISEDSVVFIDDSLTEIEEVRQAFPLMTCILFTGNDPAKSVKLFSQLRNYFGKPLVTEEDLLRQTSIRASAELRELGGEGVNPEFLGSLAGTITMDWRREPGAGRALELINKTNQFNLNGQRLSEGQWQQMMEDEQCVCAVVSYQDRLTSLGRVAVVLGSRRGKSLQLQYWVMSCRAFSRRIEHHTIAALYDQTGVEEIDFDMKETERNQPLMKFFNELGMQHYGALSRAEFAALCGPLPHATHNVS